MGDWSGLTPCVHCGQPVRGEDRFCRNCGAKVSVSQSASPITHPLMKYLHRVGAIPRVAAGDEEREKPPKPIGFDDVAGMEDLKRVLREIALVVQGRGPKGIRPWRAVLLFGPPGTGKTLVARAMAGELGWYFRAVAGSDVKSKYYGETEQVLHEVFNDARAGAPSVVFFDEADNISQRRSGSLHDEVLAQLLQEIEGFARSTASVLFLSATNVPWMLDDAFVSRMERRLLVPLPDLAGREAILRLHSRDIPLADDVDLAEVAERCAGRAGRELERVCVDAAMLVWRDCGYDPQRMRPVAAADFHRAVELNPALTSPDLVAQHEDWARRYATDGTGRVLGGSEPRRASAAMRSGASDVSEPWDVSGAALTRLVKSSFEPAPLDTWGLAVGEPGTLKDILLLRSHQRRKPAGIAATCHAFYMLGPSTRLPYALAEYCRLGMDPDDFVTDPFRHLLLQLMPAALFGWDVERFDRRLLGQWSADDVGCLVSIHDSTLTGEELRQRLSTHEAFLERVLPQVPGGEVREFLEQMLKNLREIPPRLPVGPLGPVVGIACLKEEDRDVPLRLADGASRRDESIAGLEPMISALGLAGARGRQTGRDIRDEARRLFTLAHVFASGAPSGVAASSVPPVAAGDSSGKSWHVTSRVLQDAILSSFENVQLSTGGVLTGADTAARGFIAAGHLAKSPRDAVGTALVTYALGQPLVRDFEIPWDYWQLPVELQMGPCLHLECVPSIFWQGRRPPKRAAEGAWQADDQGSWIAEFDCPLSGRSVRPKLLRHREILQWLLSNLEDEPEARDYLSATLSRLDQVLTLLPDGPFSPLVCSVGMEGQHGMLPLCVDGAPSRRSHSAAAIPAHFAPGVRGARPELGRVSAVLRRLAGEALGKDESPKPVSEPRRRVASSPAADCRPPAASIESRLADRLQALDSHVGRRLERLTGGDSRPQPAQPTSPQTPVSRRPPAKGVAEPSGKRFAGTSEEVELGLFPVEWTGYVRAYRRQNVLTHVELRTSGYRRLEDLRLSVEMADFSHPYEQMIPLLDRRSPVTLTDLPLSLKLAAFRQVTERVTGRIIASLTDASGKRLQVAHADVPILAFNECPIAREEGELIACFVQPNDPGVIEVTKLATPHAQRLNGSTAFCGYQMEDAKFVHNMVEALYLAIQQDLRITYINPPPSFELGRRLQRLRTPSQIVFREQQGTCFDLALLFAACLEHIGLHSLVFLIHGHAFFGYFAGPANYPMAVTEDWTAVHDSLERGRVVAVNSTSFCHGAGFRESQDHGARYLEKESEFEFAIDVARARQQQLLPLPFESC
jgi:ATP-dependent 26S proteasome regulatory subunit